MEHKGGYEKKRILMLEHEQKNLDELYRLVRQINERAEIVRTTRIEDAYRNVFGYEVDLIFVSINYTYDRQGENLEFVSIVKKSSRYAFVPVILVTREELDYGYFFGELHCYGILDLGFQKNYAVRLIKDALRYQSIRRKKEYLLLKSDGVVYNFRIADILFIEHHKKYTLLHTVVKTFSLQYFSCNEMLGRLKENHFLICAKGILVNAGRIRMIEKREKKIYFSDSKETVCYGETYRKQLEETLLEQSI